MSHRYLPWQDSQRQICVTYAHSLAWASITKIKLLGICHRIQRKCFWFFVNNLCPERKEKNVAMLMPQGYVHVCATLGVGVFCTFTQTCAGKRWLLLPEKVLS